MEQDRLSYITLAQAKAYTDAHGSGGLGTQANWTQTDEEADDYIKHKPDLGDLALKDDASATYTPAGSVTVSQGTDTTTSVGSVTDVGTLPTLVVDGTKLKFSAGALPTASSVSVVTASGTRSASFSGTEATVTVS